MRTSIRLLRNFNRPVQKFYLIIWVVVSFTVSINSQKRLLPTPQHGCRVNVVVISLLLDPRGSKAKSAEGLCGGQSRCNESISGSKFLFIYLFIITRRSGLTEDFGTKFYLRRMNPPEASVGLQCLASCIMRGCETFGNTSCMRSKK